MESGKDLNITATRTSAPEKLDQLIQYIHFDTKATILFKEWTITSTPAFVASCIAVFCLAVIFSLVKSYRKHRALITASATQPRTKPVEQTMLLKKLGQRGCEFLALHAYGPDKTALNLGKKVSNYLLTLVVVTFNGWLILSVLLGTETGYVLSPWKESAAEAVTTDEEDEP